MSKDRVMQYARELAAVVKQAEDMAAAIDQLTANISIAEAVDDAKQAAEFVDQRSRIRTTRAKVEALAAEKANRKDLAGAQKLLREIDARFQALHETEQTLYQMQAQFELAASTGEFDGVPEDRASAESMMSQIQARADKQLELVAALVPNKATILTLA